ncbi:ThiF family adenylyltransferase [Bradyrhizobium sp. 146]|uniref:ThiF family adenylyltransferase n=1 Tax=Bradyrhizobium sp. 146 TaxID=2782622 RepID=UPI002111CFE8|nr:ThiF family adenylyltransferase [Bradyrhizobium sp. 146]
MSTDSLTAEARRENAAMLAAALGTDLESASEALQFGVMITFDPADATAAAVADDLAALLVRTIATVTFGHAEPNTALEVLIGRVDAKTSLPSLLVHVGSDAAVIGNDPEQQRCADIPRILCLLIACYTAAATMRAVFGARLPFEAVLPQRISFDQLGIDPEAFDASVALGQAYLAGAGAIGNGFLWAARHLNFTGILHIVDDDDVSPGNLNRQIWFGKDDIGLSKAECLARLAQGEFPGLKLTPRSYRLQDLPEKSDGPWLPRLLVAVDSRRARRKIQMEFPGEVFDASTTDIREVVVHHHRQPTRGACLSCIYEADQEEFTREHHIAEHFGVSVDDVKSERISPSAAHQIAAKVHGVEASALIGIAYDTLFKQLCGEGTLQTLEGRRVVAPFAFVSVLAGTLLALEVLRRAGSGRNSLDFNYWRVSPWHPPLGRRRILRPPQTGCEFCSNPVLSSVNAALWGALPAATSA